MATINRTDLKSSFGITQTTTRAFQMEPQGHNRSVNIKKKSSVSTQTERGKPTKTKVQIKSFNVGGIPHETITEGRYPFFRRI